MSMHSMIEEIEEERRAALRSKEMVHHPSHYNKGGIECIDAMEEATKDLTGVEAISTSNVIKYCWRWKQKNGLEDLKKAKWYLDRLIDHLSKP